MSSASLELFKRALAEGTDIRFQKTTEPYTDTALCSDRHLEIMEKITNGTYRKPIALSSARIKIAAAIVAAMFLLSGCVMIYKDEIRGFIEHIYEEYIEITFSDDEYNDHITEIYKLTYVPKGYELIDSYSSTTKVRYVFSNHKGDELIFSQSPLNTSYGYNIEGNYSSSILTINDYNVYCIQTDINYVYLWDNGKHSMQIATNTAVPAEELRLIIEGIQSK
jgi:hypothetical protein